jgi:hypothetical protein
MKLLVAVQHAGHSRRAPSVLLSPNDTAPWEAKPHGAADCDPISCFLMNRVPPKSNDQFFPDPSLVPPGKDATARSSEPDRLTIKIYDSIKAGRSLNRPGFAGGSNS